MFEVFLPWNPSHPADVMKYYFFLDVTNKEREWSKADDNDDQLSRPLEPWLFLDLIGIDTVSTIVHKSYPNRYGKGTIKCAILMEKALSDITEDQFLYFNRKEEMIEKFSVLAGKTNVHPGEYNILKIDCDADYFVNCPVIRFKDHQKRLDSQIRLLDWLVELENKYCISILSTTLSDDEKILTLCIEHNSMDTFTVDSYTDDVVTILCDYKRGCKTMAASSSTLIFPSTVTKLEFK